MNSFNTLTATEMEIVESMMICNNSDAASCAKWFINNDTCMSPGFVEEQMDVVVDEIVKNKGARFEKAGYTLIIKMSIKTSREYNSKIHG